MEEVPKRGRGRPVTTGVTPKRNIRIGDLWDRAEVIARRRDETMTDIVKPAVERALRRYIRDNGGSV